MLLQKRGRCLMQYFSMSVMSPSNQVKHYRIRKLDSGGFFISNKVRFQNMVELVSHYRAQADGLW